MPRGKAGLKSPTKADPKENLPESSTVGMKDIESTAPVDIREEEGTCELSIQSELPNNISDMSVNANTKSNEEDGSSLPRKPKRLLTFAGRKKKDAKESQSGEKTESTDNNKQASPGVETPQKQHSIKAERDNTSPKKKKNICESYKQQFFDDGHAYEDPSLLVNNSTTPLHMTEQNYLENPKDAIKKQSKMEERSQSPSSVKTGLSKSTESIKAAVKGLKEGHTSIMSETSIPRSIFAALVALLLSLIVFLAVYFLLHCPAVLSVAVSILVYVVIFINLGFMDGKRMKCLILLLLPSVCSRGGRLALYLLLGYFVITGPFCNMIGNIKAVKNSMQCMNNERPEVVREIIKTFEAAQQCVNSRQVLSTKVNKSTEIQCLEQRIEQRCLSVKDKFQRKCGQKHHKIAPKLCELSAEISCMNASIILRNLQACPKELPERYCHNEFNEILEFLDKSSSDDGCGFLEIFSMLFPLLIIFVLYEGYNYENNYRTYNDFHNFFLTGHFQVIDQSRSSCDRDAVLPLRKVELRKHVRPATVFNLTDIEKKELWSNLKTYLLAVLIVLFMILVDLYMFRMFDMKNNGKLQSDNTVTLTNITPIAPIYPVTNTSEHFVDTNKTMQINNETQLSNITDFKVNTTFAPETNPTPLVETTDVCSASVDPPGSISKIILPIILSLLLLVIIFQAHVSRLRWYICSRLYTMREKERVFYLYNKILKDRVQLVEDCRKRMKCYHREMKTRNSLEITRILAQQLPWLSKIFKIFHINLRRCIICNDSEKPEFKICHGLDCSCIYCLTCSFDIDKKCLYCDTELKHSLSQKQLNEKVVSSKESLV